MARTSPAAVCSPTPQVLQRRQLRQRHVARMASRLRLEGAPSAVVTQNVWKLSPHLRPPRGFEKEADAGASISITVRP